MRITIAFVPAGNPRGLAAASAAMAEELRARGHEVEVFQGDSRGGLRLAACDYFILGTEPLGLRGSLPPRVESLLAQATGGSGRRSMAFVLKRGPFRNRSILRLMKAMEAQGMNVNYCEVLRNRNEAALAARAAPVEKSPA